VKLWEASGALKKEGGQGGGETPGIWEGLSARKSRRRKERTDIYSKSSLCKGEKERAILPEEGRGTKLIGRHELGKRGMLGGLAGHTARAS